MFFNLTQFMHWAMFICASYYESFGFSMPNLSMPHFNKPEIHVPEVHIEVPKVPEIDQSDKEQAIEMSKIAANMSGHESTEEMLDIALSYTRQHNNMKAATRLLEDLATEGLTKK